MRMIVRPFVILTAWHLEDSCTCVRAASASGLLAVRVLTAPRGSRLVPRGAGTFAQLVSIFIRVLVGH
jgi:hypothetical protein